MAQLSDAALSSFSANQVAALTVDSVLALTGDQLQSLGANVAALSSDAIANLSSAQVAGLAASQIASLNPLQAQSLSDAAIASLSDAQVKALSGGQLAALTADQVSNIANIAALAPSALQSLDGSQVASLSVSQLAELSGSAINNLSAVQFATLSDTQVMSLSTEQLAALTPQNISNVHESSIAALSNAQIASLNASQLNTFTAGQIQSLSASQLQSLAPSTLANLQGRLIRSLTTSQVESLTYAQLAALTSTQIADLKSNLDLAEAPNDAAIVDLTPSQVASLSASQLQALSAAQIQSLTAQQLQALSIQQLAEFLPIQLQSLTANQLQNLTSQQIESLTQPLADLGIQILAAGGAPYTGGDSAGSNGAIVAGDKSAVPSEQYVVLYDPNGSQTLVTSSSTLLPDGGFDSSIAGGSTPSATAPSAPLTGIMRSRSRCVVALLVFLIAATGLARAAVDCGKPSGTSSPRLDKLIASINDEGLKEFSAVALDRPDNPWSPSFSPFGRWYTRFLLSLGSSQSPSQQEQAEAETLTAYLRSLPGHRINTAIWINTRVVKLSQNQAESLRVAACADLHESAWDPLANGDAPVDSSIDAWIDAQHAGEGRAWSSSFVQSLRKMTKRATGSAHQFTIVTAMNANGEFDSLNEGLFAAVSVPFVETAGVQGVRLDASHDGISLFLFSGGSEAISDLKQSLNSNERWKALTAKFEKTKLYVMPTSVVAQDESGFDPGLSEAFNSCIRPSYNYGHAREQTQFSALQNRFDLSVLTGDDGVPTDQCLALIDRFYFPHPRAFSAAGASLLVVADKGTGLILLISARDSRKALPAS